MGRCAGSSAGASHLARARRMLRAVAHLQPGQLLHRVRLQTRRALWSRMPERVEARYRARALRLAPPSFAHPGLRRVAELRRGRSSCEKSLAVATDALAGRFHFLGVTRDLGRDVEWFRPDLDTGTRLWKTLLHEFPYAVDLARAHRETGDPAFRARFFELARSWRAASPIARPGFALDCWNARAVARRLLNWAVAGSLLGLEPEEPDASFLGRELAVHALFLADNLEWDLRANHLLSDLTALALAHALLGCAPHALSLLRRQLDAQILADGCHEELVPMYHAVALQELVELRAALEDPPVWLEEKIERMAGFLAYLLPADGMLPLLGDSFHGEVAPLRVLEEAGGREPAPATGLAVRSSGLVVLRAGRAHLVMRAGAHGPDHQLGHAHADGLSFELSLADRRVVTDTGTPTYDAGPARARARSTAAHNTVQVDAEEQIEAWGSFRVGRRGRGHVEGFGEPGDWTWVAACYDGWRWLPGAPLHRRLLALSEAALLVVDVVEGSGWHLLRSALHLHPDRPEGVRALPLDGRAEEGAAPLHERFNEQREATELFVEAEAELPWASGWLISFEAAAAQPRVALCLQDGLLHLRCRHPGPEVDLRWHLARPGAGSVEIARELPKSPG